MRSTFRVKGGLFGADRHVVAVDDVSFSVPAGGVLGVVGESGCGKSTLARLILGLLEPSAGDIAVEGQRVLDMDRKARARLIQPVFQDPFASLNPLARMRDIVGHAAQAPRAVSVAPTIAKRVDEMLARVGLSAEMGGACRPSFAAASASASPSPAPWCCARASWCATSRPARSTSRCRRRS